MLRGPTGTNPIWGFPDFQNPPIGGNCECFFLYASIAVLRNETDATMRLAHETFSCPSPPHLFPSRPINPPPKRDISLDACLAHLFFGTPNMSAYLGLEIQLPLADSGTLGHNLLGSSWDG